jgi:ribosomal protein S12 methylthiotransferase accessory factor
MNAEEIVVDFPGGKRVDAHVGAHTVATDQPVGAGGADSAPAPFDLFLAALGACAGFYVLAYCQARGLPTDGLRLLERVDSDPETKRPRRVEIAVRLPADFPAGHEVGLQRAANACKVKKVLADPPLFDIVVTRG